MSFTILTVIGEVSADTHPPLVYQHVSNTCPRNLGMIDEMKVYGQYVCMFQSRRSWLTGDANMVPKLRRQGLWLKSNRL